MRFSFEHQRTQRLELEGAPGQPECRGAHHDIAGGRDRLEPLRRVHGVAHYGVCGLHLAGQQATDHFTTGDPNPQGKPPAVLALEPVIQQRERALHVDRCPDSALGVVLMGDRSAEDRHDGVADVLLDGAFISVDRPHERGEKRSQDPA